MKITYIEHSSFLVELERCYLLFDYFQGELPEMDKAKTLYVFASHRHGDHFSTVIFELADKRGNVKYVISDDIWKKRVPKELWEKTVFVHADQDTEIDDIRVKTYQSTDEGVAFLIKAEGRCIYHAGDLNHWYWNGESDEWNRKMGENYQKELKKMAGEKIDVAFVPVDPRLEESFGLGADEFMTQVGAEVMFPMHFWGDYSVGMKLKSLPCAADYRSRVIELHSSGESFVLFA